MAITHSAYVYAILVDGIVRYIGKGSGRRIHKHMQTARKMINLGRHTEGPILYQRLAGAVLRGEAITYEILADNLSHEDAYDQETIEIGAVRIGQLWNFCSGGLGATSEDAKRKWADPEYRQRQMAAASRPEVKAKKSAGQRASQSPNLQASRRASQSAAFDKPGVREQRVAIAKNNWNNPEYRQRVIDGRKAQWAGKSAEERRSLALAAWKTRRANVTN